MKNSVKSTSNDGMVPKLKDISEMVQQSQLLLQQIKEKDYLLSGNLLSDRSLKGLNDINDTI